VNWKRVQKTDLGFGFGLSLGLGSRDQKTWRKLGEMKMGLDTRGLPVPLLCTDRDINRGGVERKGYPETYCKDRCGQIEAKMRTTFSS
jgi:hypothetical protein